MSMYENLAYLLIIVLLAFASGFASCMAVVDYMDNKSE